MTLVDRRGSPRPDEVDIRLARSSKFQEINPIEVTPLLPLLEKKTAALIEKIVASSNGIANAKTTI